MAKNAKLKGELQSVLKDTGDVERELDAFTAVEIAASEGDEEAQAIARWGRSAAGATMRAWRSIMQQIADVVEDERTKMPFADLCKAGDLTLKSLHTLTGLKLKADAQVADTLLVTQDAISGRIRNQLGAHYMLKDASADAIDRKRHREEVIAGVLDGVSQEPS